jgi:hypothetical protein
MIMRVPAIRAAEQLTPSSRGIKRLKELAKNAPLARAESGCRRGAPPSGARAERLQREWPALDGALQQAPAEALGAAARDRFLQQLRPAGKRLPGHHSRVTRLQPAGWRYMADLNRNDIAELVDSTY